MEEDDDLIDRRQWTTYLYTFDVRNGRFLDGLPAKPDQQSCSSALVQTLGLDYMISPERALAKERLNMKM